MTAAGRETANGRRPAGRRAGGKMMRNRTSAAFLGGLSLVLLLAACAEREVILPGERFDVTVPLESTIPVEGQPAPVQPQVENRSVPISLPRAVANADWTHRGENARHLAPNVALSAQPQPIWSAPVGEGNSRRYRITTTPVAAGGRVFTLDARALVAATSAGGATLWQTNLTPASDRGGEAAGGGIAFGDGKLFVTTAFGELVALDPATGGVVWRQRFLAPVTGSPTVADGIVYVVARDSSGWAVTTDDGRLRWQIPSARSMTSMTGSAGPAMADRLVLLPFPTGQLTGALRQGGLQVWDAAVMGQRLGAAYGPIGGITAEPVVAGATTYVGNAAGRAAALETATGETLWQAREGAASSLAVAGGSIFLVNDKAELVRLDAATGELVWKVELPYFTEEKVKRRKAIYAHYGPILAGGRLVVASSDGLLRLFSPTDGTLVGSVAMPSGAASGPIVAGGILYVVGQDGQLHAFR